MAKPTFSSTKKPSSSGPRCTMRRFMPASTSPVHVPVAIGEEDSADSAHIRLASLRRFAPNSGCRRPVAANSAAAPKRCRVGREIRVRSPSLHDQLRPLNRPRAAQLQFHRRPCSIAATTENQLLVEAARTSLPADELRIAQTTNPSARACRARRKRTSTLHPPPHTCTRGTSPDPAAASAMRVNDPGPPLGFFQCYKQDRKLRRQHGVRR